MAKVFSVAFICMIAGASASGKHISQHIEAVNITDTDTTMMASRYHDVRQLCKWKNPCTISVSASYKNWDYVRHGFC